MKQSDLPLNIPVFPLSNFIIFPKTTVPLNIFEPRYIDMINDSMKSNKLVGMIQPKFSKEINDNIPQLHTIGCMGKITSFRETEDSRFLIELKGLIRFKITNEISENEKNARQAEQFLKRWRTRLWRSGKQENRNLRVEKSKGLESNRNENDGRNR